MVVLAPSTTDVDFETQPAPEDGEDTQDSDKLRQRYLHQKIALREARRRENAERISAWKKQKAARQKQRLGRGKKGTDYAAHDDDQIVVADLDVETAAGLVLESRRESLDEEEDDEEDDEEEDDLPLSLQLGSPNSPSLNASQHDQEGNNPSTGPAMDWTEGDFVRAEKKWSCSSILGVQRYSNRGVEASYRRFCLDNFVQAAVTGQIMMLLLCVVTWIAASLEGTNTVPSVVLLAAALILGMLRLFFRYSARRKRHGVGRVLLDLDGLNTVPMFCLVVVGGFATQNPSHLNGKSLFFIIACSAAVREELSPYAPGVVYACLSVCVFGVGTACVAYMHPSPNLLMYALLGAVFVGYGLCVVVFEQQRRSHFEAVMLAKVLQDRAEFAVQTHHALLEMLIPPPLIPAIKKKVDDAAAHGQGTPADMVQWLGDVCVATLKISPFRLSGDLRPLLARGGSKQQKNIQGLFRRLESAAELLERAIGIRGDGLLYKVSTLGDVVTVAGPIVDAVSKTPTDAQIMGQSENVANVALLNLDSEEDNVLKAAVAMVDMVRVLLRSFGSKAITGAVTCDSAFAGVMGTTRPSLDLLGNATRSTRAVVEAAPAGFVGFLGQLVRLLEAGRKCPPTFVGDIELGPSQPWALRGHGLARLRPVRMPRTAMASRDPTDSLTEGLFAQRGTTSPQQYNLSGSGLLSTTGLVVGFGGEGSTTATDTTGGDAVVTAVGAAEVNSDSVSVRPLHSGNSSNSLLTRGTHSTIPSRTMTPQGVEPMLSVRPLHSQSGSSNSLVNRGTNSTTPSRHSTMTPLGVEPYSVSMTAAPRSMQGDV